MKAILPNNTFQICSLFQISNSLVGKRQALPWPPRLSVDPPLYHSCPPLFHWRGKEGGNFHLLCFLRHHRHAQGLQHTRVHWMFYFPSHHCVLFLLWLPAFPNWSFNHSFHSSSAFSLSGLARLSSHQKGRATSPFLGIWVDWGLEPKGRYCDFQGDIIKTRKTSPLLSWNVS